MVFRISSMRAVKANYHPNAGKKMHLQQISTRRFIQGYTDAKDPRSRSLLMPLLTGPTQSVVYSDTR